MTGSVRRHLGVRSALRAVVMLASYFVYIDSAANDGVALTKPRRRDIRVPGMV